METQEKTLLGHVGVDSGTLMITDPCYIRTDWKHEDMDSDDYQLNKKRIRDGEEIAFPYSYEGIGMMLDHPNQGVELDHGTGVAFQSGFGDGTYPVYAEYEDYGDWGRRIKRVVIELITDEEDPNQEPWE